MPLFCNRFRPKLIRNWFCSLMLPLVACGGGGTDNSNVPTPATPLTLGVYQNTDNGNDITTLLADPALVNSPTPNWFGIEFPAGSLYPNLYSARIDATGNTSATAIVTESFQLARTGNVTLSMSSTTQQLSQLALAAALPSNWTATKLASKQYNEAPLSKALNDAFLNATWTGNWYFGVGASNTSFSAPFALSNGVALNQAVSQNCPIDNTAPNVSQLSTINGVNLYLVNLYFRHGLFNCTLNDSNTLDANYQGLALIDLNPDTGRNRLRVMAIGPNNKGLFFKGDRSSP